MARPKQKWTSEEEEALAAGVEKHGLGRWKTILNDPQFATSLANRSNVDLKDKWRNLSGNDGGSSSRRNVGTPMIEFNTNPPLTNLEPPSSSMDKRTAPSVSIADNMEEVTNKAGKEDAKLDEMVDESVAMLELAKDIYERCSRDGVVYLDP